MLIYRMITVEEWNDLKARTEALLATDLKEYHSFSKLYDEHVKALSAWTLSQSEVDVFRRGDPSVYMARIRAVLKRIKDMTRYPRLITPEHPAKPLYIANVPASTAPQIPGVPTPEPIAPPEIPKEWNRYMDFDSYKDQLSPALQKEGKELLTWFTNRRRLHDLAKNQEREGVNKDTIAATLAEMDAQEAQISGFFDRVEAFMTGSKQSDTNKYEDVKPSGSFCKIEIEEMQTYNPVCAALSKEKRIAANRKFISRKDLMKPKDPDELALRIRELQEWGVPVPAMDEEEAKEEEDE